MSQQNHYAIFWDIENIPIPSNKSSSGVTKAIRDYIQEKHPECGYACEFICVCDSKKLDRKAINGLDRGGVTIIQSNSTAKNAADDKLKEQIHKFMKNNANQNNPTLVLMTGDGGFAPTIRLARNRKFNVILIYGKSCDVDLKNFVLESHFFNDIIKDVEPYKTNDEKREVDMIVNGLPTDTDSKSIGDFLSILCKNTGGKVKNVGNGSARIRFSCIEDLRRAQQRMRGENIDGKEIDVETIEEIDRPNSRDKKSKPQNRDEKSGQKSTAIQSHSHQSLETVEKFKEEPTNSNGGEQGSAALPTGKLPKDSQQQTGTKTIKFFEGDGHEIELGNVDAVGDEVIVDKDSKPEKGKNVDVSFISGSNMKFKGGDLKLTGSKTTYK